MGTGVSTRGRAMNIAVRLVKRWAPVRLRRNVWESEYASGRWDYLDEGDHDLPVALMEKYAQGGRVLDLGCGTTRNLRLTPGTYAQYVGVDISSDAIARARLIERPDSVYQVADVTTYRPEGRFDLVFLREVVYYLPARAAADLIRRSAECLTPGGVIVVVIWNVRLYRRTVRAVRGCGVRLIDEISHHPGAVTLVLGRPAEPDPDRIRKVGE